MLRHDPPTGAWRHLNVHLEKGGVHTPRPNERIFLLLANLIGNG